MGEKSSTQDSKQRGRYGDGTIRYSQSKKLWEGRYYTEPDPITGRKIQKSVYGKTKTEVSNKLRKKIHSVKDGKKEAKSDMLFSDWLSYWMESKKNKLKPRTISTYNGIINTRINPVIGHLKLKSITRDTLEQFYLKMFTGEIDLPWSDENKKKNKPKDFISEKSIKNIHSIIRLSLGDAAQKKLIESSPADRVTLPSEDDIEIIPKTKDVKESKHDVLSITNIQTFLDNAKDDEYSDLFTFTLLTGLRIAEVIGLTWDCVDFDKMELYVLKQLHYVTDSKAIDKSRGHANIESEHYLWGTVKNKEPRVIPLPKAVIEGLQKIKVKQEEKEALAGDLWENEKMFVFTNDIGKHRCPQTIRKHFKKIAKKIQKPELRFHDLRHSYATIRKELSEKRRIQIDDIQKDLGHKTKSVTEQVYIHETDFTKNIERLLWEKFIEENLTLYF